MGFASFLLAKNIQLDSFKDVEGSPNIAEFVFNISIEDPLLNDLIMTWMSSPSVKPLKRILYYNKLLKHDLKHYLLNKNAKKINEQAI